MALLSGWNRKSRSKNIKSLTLSCEGLEDRRVLATLVGTEAAFVTALGAGDPCIELTANITLSGSALTITSPVEILGAGFTVDAAGMSRVFTIDDGLGYVDNIAVSMDNITITGGAGTSYGGGIWNNTGNLTITNSSITGNQAIDPGMNYTGTGGGILTNGTLTMSNTSVTGNTASSLVDLPTTGGGFYITGLGGGIDTGVYAVLNLTDVNVDGNDASNLGGGLNIASPGPHVITGGTFNNNVIGNAASQSTLGTNVFGGGIAQDSAGVNMTITGSVISGNMGGQTAAAGDDSFDYGIGLDLTTRGVADVITLDGVTVSNNVQTTDGVIAGETSVQRGTGITMTAVEGGTFNLLNSTVSGNVMSDQGDFPGYGGGVSMATFDTGAGVAYPGYFNVDNTNITGNTGMRGGGWGTRYNGGYYNDGVGARSQISITNSNITGNSAIGDGGGANWSWVATNTYVEDSLIDGNVSVTAGAGGFFAAKVFANFGIYANSDLTVRDSTISNNSAAGTGGGFEVSTGGLTYPGQDNTIVTIENSVISGNSSTGGGGVYAYDADVILYQVQGTGNYAAGTGGFMAARTYYGYVGLPSQPIFDIDRSTIAANNAAGAGGGVYADYYSAVSIDDSIISGNTTISAGPDLYAAQYGAFTVNYSLVGDDTAANLAPGAGNLLNMNPMFVGGGNYALMAGSPAIDAANPASTGAFDLAGNARVQNGRMDMGAFEYGMGNPVTGDFDGDGDWDCEDINMLTAETAAGTNNPLFDMTGDGPVNFDDIMDWLAVAGGINLLSGNPYAVGDANLDGTVDGLDFIQWNNAKFTTNTAWCGNNNGGFGGNFNGDSVTDGLDFIDWNANKFTQQGPIVAGGIGSTIDSVGSGSAVAAVSAGRANPEAELSFANVKTSNDGHEVRMAAIPSARPRAQVASVFQAPTAATESAGIDTPVIAEGADRVAGNSSLSSFQVEDASTEVRRTAASTQAIDAIFADLS